MAATVASQNVTRPWGPGTAAIARWLIASAVPLTGVAVARAVGVSQPRASQVLKQFAGHGAVRATADGYIGDAGMLMDLYRRRSRPTLVGKESYWYSTRSMEEQARILSRRAATERTSIAFSADLGPDLLVPWRHPSVTIAYVSGDPAPITDDLVPAEGRADASIVLRRTNDRTLLVPADGWPREVDGIPITDPVQQWRDLLDLGGDDRLEAAARLRAAILRRSIEGTR